MVENDPEFDGPNTYFESREGIYAEGIRLSVLLVKIMKKHGLSSKEDFEVVTK